MRKKSVNLYFDNTIDSKTKLDEIKKLGYDEFYTGIYDKNETLKFEEQLKYAKELGLKCSMIHCSYYEPTLNQFWEEGEVGENICNSYCEQIERSKGFSKDFVVHLNGGLNSKTTSIGLKRIEKMLKVCETCNINLCIENLYSAEEIPYIFENIKHPNLKICFDIGHKNFLTKDFDLMRYYGGYVTVLHLHDNDGEHDLHNICGTGTVNFNEFAKQASNYPSLVLCAEIKSKEPGNIKILADNLKALNNLDKLIVKNENLMLQNK